MTRKIVLACSLFLVLLFLAALEFSGHRSTLTGAAQNLKHNLDDKFRGHSDSHTQPQQFCRWTFSHYESSAYEQEWIDSIETAQKSICQTVASQRHADISKKIVQRVRQLYNLDDKVKWRTVDAISPSALHESDEYMSRMHYKRECYDASDRSFKSTTGLGVQLIEPLWGMLRDPFDGFCSSLRLSMPEWNEAFGQSKQHIMPQGYAPYWYDPDAVELDQSRLDGWRTHGMPPWYSSYTVEHDVDLGTVYAKPRNVHLDLGSSYFAGWSIMGGEGNVNTAASGQWFYDTYHARGTHFDAFIAVELEILNDTFAYQQVPPDLIGHYTLMNVALSMEEGDRLNTIDLIKRIVKPEDFFVFKLDIDSAPIEAPIIKSLLEDNALEGGASGLIDELMFEHHVDCEPMNGAWWHGREIPPETLVDSYALFKDLRHKGIRAHSWP